MMSAVERWRAKKALAGNQTAGVGDGGSDAEDGPDNSSSTSMRELNRRRLEIQKKRKEQRNKYDSGSESEGMTSKRSGSKLRAIQDRMKTPTKERLRRNLEKAIDEDSDEENQGDKNQELDDGDDDANEIITNLEPPPHIFPLVVAPTTREAESKKQPSLAIPAPYPNISNIYNAITKTPGVNLSGKQTLRESSETLRYVSRDHMHFSHHVVDPVDDDDRESTVSELEMLIKDDNTVNISSSYQGEIVARNIVSTERAFDGMHVGHPASMAALQLRSEEMAMVGGTMGGHRMRALNLPLNVHFSRATQRLIRDIPGVKEENEIRVDSKVDEIKVPLLHADKKFGALLCVPEDHYESRNLSEPVIPEPLRVNGGELGQWSDSYHDNDKYGAIIDASYHAHDDNRALLNVHVGTLRLEEHPLLIEEERLAVRLRQLYSQYSLLYENSAMFYLVSRLNNVIDSLEDLIDKVGKYDEEEDENEYLNHLLNMIEYLKNDILESVPALRDLRDEANSLTNSLYETWKQIKKVRQDQGFTSTRVSLTPILIKDKRYGKSRNDETSKTDDTDDNGQTSTIYKTDESWYHLCNESLPKLVGPDNLISRALTTLNKNPFDGTVNGDSSSSTSDRAASLSKKTHQVDFREDDKGNKPQRILKECVADLTSNKLEAKKGIVPEVGFKLTELGGYTPDSACNSAEEVTRRSRIKSLKFKARLSMSKLVSFLNDNSTANCCVTFPELKVEFDHVFQISLIHKPSDIHIDLCTPGGWGSEFVCASIITPLPGEKSKFYSGSKYAPVTSSYAPIASSYTFSSSEAYEVSTFGTYITSRNIAKKSHRIGGSLFVVTEFELTSIPVPKTMDGIKAEDISKLPKPSIDAIKREHAMGVTDFVKEKDFMKLMPKLSELDVNDPRNENLLGMIMSAGGMISSAFSSDKIIFRLNNDESNLLLTENGYSYANFMKFQQSLRIKLLQLRSKKPYLFTGPISLDEEALKRSDLYKNIISSASPGDSLENGRLVLNYETAAGISESNLTEQNDEYGDTSRGSKRKVNDFMNRVRESRQLLAKPMRKFIMTSHVVSEVDENPSWDWIRFWSLSWLIPKRVRKLKPTTGTKNSRVIQVRKCDLLVQVVSAKNIPVKVDKDGYVATASVSRQNRNQMKRAKNKRRSLGLDDEDDSADDSINDESDEDDVWAQDHSAESETFVEVRFQESTARTTSVAGKAPLWKQSLKLPFKAPQDDYSPSSVEQIRADVHISIFDEISKSANSYVGDEDEEDRVERRFLGSVSIPFNTIVTEGKIEGVFRVNTPAFNWGYGVASSDISSTEKNESVEQPSILNCFGFLKSKDESSRSNIPGKNLDSVVESELNHYATGSSSMFVKLMITLDPLISLVESKKALDDISPSFLAMQDRPLAGYAHKFLQELRSRGAYTADRPYMLFAPDSSGQSVFIPRYLSAMKPPMEIDTVRACIHLVSQLPFASDVHTFDGAVDMWCQVSQVWEMVAGDEEEHAILLFNYIYYITSQRKGKNAKNDIYLCLGNAIPEGNTVYVVMHESVVVEGGSQSTSSADNVYSSPSRASPQEWLIINPVSGFVFSAADSNCPLLEIACLVTPDNVYANVAFDAKPCKTSFDLSNSDSWRPFFGTRFPPPTNGISPIQMHVKYVPTLASYALDIERSLTSNVKNTLRRIRGQRRLSATTFHPDASNCVRDILSTIDDFMLGKEDNRASSSLGRTQTRERSNTRDRSGKNHDKSSSSVVRNRFQQLIAERMSGILRNKELFGFPINTPFTDIDEITELIKSLCVHENKHPEVQFVFAVRAIPYTNQMISLWFFLGTLENM